MLLPWKKNKVARISRFVADLQSPKRGGSLVVQTGFPTSLVDLFVKNRDRLKKHSKKKSQSQSQSQSHSQSQSQTQQTHSQMEFSNTILNLTVDSSSSSKPRNEITTTHVQEIAVVEEFDGGGGGGVDGSNRNIVLVAVLKMFVVLVLALSTKRLAVGVTMSAILLLLLEYVGARWLFCSKKTSFLASSLRKIKSNKDVLSVKKTEICEESTRNLVDDIGINPSFEEIQAEEEDRRSCLNIESREKIVKELLREDVLMTSKNNRSRGTKIKEKLVKRLVPKKLRGGSKKGKDQVESSSNQVSCFSREDKLGKLLEQEQDNENESSIVSLKDERSSVGSVFYDETTCFDRQSQAEEKVEKDSEGKSGYLILILIVLAGLVGGRIVALVLTLGWCLMLKLVRNSRIVSFSISWYKW
ncbi:hypothetical protein Ddye_020039 [Dipteronia dyeriana]|uniref:Ethylene-responsive nuclear protein n=1 Tax=Dipteronia dyeriana TaxID=168575 RepID=A0AAD9TYW0_9ROSI|nr:hypothetical protein Ddye_020039 [Dipteronia dyeriana]